MNAERPAVASAVARGWRAFRRWRRGRPFWGSVFMLLGGLELFASANLDLTDLRVHVGPEGFLSYLLPVLLVAAAVLAALTPKQRVFYSIIGTLTAIYSLIGLNLGGFLLGMLLGIVGGALTFAWTPVTPVEPAPGSGPAGSDPGETGPAQAEPATGSAIGRSGAHREGDDETEVLGGSRDERDEADSLRDRSRARHRSTLAVSIAVPFLLAVAVGAGGVPGRAAGAPVRAATPCPTGNPALAGKPPTGVAAAPPPAAPTTTQPAPAGAPAAAGAAGSTTSTATARTSPTPMSKDDQLLQAWIDFWTKVLHLPQPTPSPTPTPKPTPAPTAKPTGPTPTTPGGPSTTASTPTGSTCQTGPGQPAAPSPSVAPLVAAAAGQPIVAATPGHLTADVQVLQGFSFVGVTTLPTATGSVRALQFAAARAVSTNFSLSSGAAGTALQITSNPLTVSGNVTLFASRFSGKLLGIPLTFTPEVPPPLTLPDMVFTDVTIELVFLDCRTLQAPTLGQSSA